MDKSIPVIAYDFDTKRKVGTYTSISQAGRKLFIKNGDVNIWHYIFGGTKGVTFAGVKTGVSDKFGKKYHFEIVKPLTEINPTS